MHLRVLILVYTLVAIAVVDSVFGATQPDVGTALLVGRKDQIEIFIRTIDGTMVGNLPLYPAYQKEFSAGTHKIGAFCVFHHEWGDEMGPAVELEHEFLADRVYQMEYVGKKEQHIVKITASTLSRAEASIPEKHLRRIEISVPPFYISRGPKANAGRFSEGLASSSDEEFVATIWNMKDEWNHLTFPELYVGAIRLYEHSYLDVSVYWFYSAQYRGRQFALFMDQGKIGGPGTKALELLEAQNTFFQVSGPYFNTYAFKDPDALVSVIEKVRKEGEPIQDLVAAYPGVAFRDKNEWNVLNAELAAGMEKLISMVKDQKSDARPSGTAESAEEKPSFLTSKDLPSRPQTPPKL